METRCTVSHGKHRKIEPKNHKGAAVATTGALALGGLFAASGNASAAPEDAWDSIAQCESGGVWDLPYGDRDSTGGLQFRVASWGDALAQLRADGIDTSGFPSMPYLATKAQQILAGEALLKLQGPNAWTCNGIQGGPLNGYSGGDYSRYLGGAPAPVDPPAPDPAPVPDKPKPKPPVEPSPEDAAEDSPQTVTVQPGDTLYGITKLRTGDASLDNWEPLYEANRDVIGSDPDLIYPGQVLSLPWSSAGDHKVHDDTNGPADPPPPADPAPVDTPPANTAEYRSPLVDMSGIGDGYIANGGCVSRSCGGHSGVDFTAPTGTDVRAVHAGTVIVGGAGAAYGNHVLVDHGDGIWTLYGHLNSVAVSNGQSVAAGDSVGTVGSTGNSSGPHLHFEVRTNGTQFNGFLDPVAWLTSHGIIN